MSREKSAVQSEDGRYAERALGVLKNYPRDGADLRACSDQYVGLIESLRTSSDFPVRVPASQRPSNQHCVLLILESPHRQEFLPPDADPKPANGQTGKNIRTYFSSVEGLQGLGNYGLILVNAVQYQCSKGEEPLPRTKTDSIFRELWLTGGKQDLTLRLRKLVRDGDMLVNACVSGKSNSHKKSLRSWVQLALDEANFGLQTLHRFHPSWWHVNGRRSPRKPPY